MKKTFYLWMALTAIIVALGSCKGEPAVLSVNPAELTFDGFVGGSKEVTLTATADWSVTECPDWLSLSAESGSATEGRIISVLCDKGAQAEGDVVFEMGEEHATLHVVRQKEEQKEPELVAGAFSVAAGKQVKFAPGNLQYQASTNTWRFAEQQYLYSNRNDKIDNPGDNWIDLFGWGTGSQPTKYSEEDDDYTVFVDWGVNPIDTYPARTWRTLSSEEWKYLIEERKDAAALYALANVCGVNGLLILPDVLLTTMPVAFTAGVESWKQNTYEAEDWELLEKTGAIFLPATGYRVGTQVSEINKKTFYWSSTPHPAIFAEALNFMEGSINLKLPFIVHAGAPVRLVRDNF